VANSRLAAGEHRGCVGRPVGDDGGSGCDSAAQAVSISRARATGSVAPTELFKHYMHHLKASIPILTNPPKHQGIYKL
jgi:hypothetical protein